MANATANMIRNLLLILFVVLPLLAALLAVPLLTQAQFPESWSPVLLYWLSVAFGTLGFLLVNLWPASATLDQDHKEAGSAPHFLRFGQVALLLSAVLMAWSVARFATEYELEFQAALHYMVIWSLVPPAAAFTLANLLQGRMLHREQVFFRDLIALVLLGAVDAVIYAAIVGNWAEPVLASPYPLYPVLAPIFYLGPMLMAQALFIAFVSGLDNVDREWWARYANVLIAAIAWVVASIIVFFGPTLLGLVRYEIGSRITTAGFIGFLGWIIRRLGSGNSNRWRKWVLAVAAPPFCLALLLLVSVLTQDVLRAVFTQSRDYDNRWIPPFQGEVWQVLAAIVVLGIIGLGMGRYAQLGAINLSILPWKNRVPDQIINDLDDANHQLKRGSRVTSAFISYSWDSEEHRQWVLDLATRLRADRIETLLDRWHVIPGDQLPDFMEKAVRESDYILIICTRRYKEKSDRREGGVGYEGDIINGEVFTTRNQRKFIPILRFGEWADAAPTWLRGKYYIDLRGTPYEENHYQDLVTTLLGTRPVAPPIGLGVRQVAANGPTAGSSEAIALSNRQEDFEPIGIIGVVVDEITTPRADGTQGSALYSIPFRFSRHPPSEWAKLFVYAWDHPTSYTSMHRPGIARTLDDKVILEGTTVDEVEKYHRNTLLLAADQANQRYAEWQTQSRAEEERERSRLEAHRKSVEDAAKRLKF
ncbi:MAG TPA: toll/interleukin-1 receptor domain-containing protein [Thermoanaerobaculia bacterium]|nr:toll/interleukin-1 receptor domain-containing protein [Thermoanaerobaculia bacterium]